MASMRRKYQSRVEDSAPVASTPVQAAEPPPVAADAKPPEPINTESPADVAAKHALRDRLREMEQAETIVREATTAQQPQQPQQPTLEEAIAHLPERIQRWCKTASAVHLQSVLPWRSAAVLQIRKPRLPRVSQTKLRLAPTRSQRPQAPLGSKASSPTR